MIHVLESKKQEIASACRKYRAVRVDVFGSALRNDFNKESDIDLLVEFESMSPHELADSYFGLLNELRSILEYSIDLVMADAVKNRYIAEDIQRTKKVLYAA